MKKQATYISDTPIKESSQAAGFLHEDLRALDHEESWVLFLNAANMPLTKKMITVGTIMSAPIDHRRIIKDGVRGHPRKGGQGHRRPPCDGIEPLGVRPGPSAAGPPIREEYSCCHVRLIVLRGLRASRKYFDPGPETH